MSAAVRSNPGAGHPRRVAAVVPINRLDRVKSRLAPVLPLEERQALVLWMAERVLRAIQASGQVKALAVVSPDPAVLAWAAARGATPLAQESGTLNDGLALGRTWATEQEAEALLIALADLPLLQAEEITAAMAALWATDEARGLVLASDRASRGTNLLVARPIGFAPLLFGRDSLARFEHAATLAGIVPTLFASEGTGFDVDVPSDLYEVRARGLWQPCDQPAQRLG